MTSLMPVGLTLTEANDLCYDRKWADDAYAILSGGNLGHFVLTPDGEGAMVHGETAVRSAELLAYLATSDVRDEVFFEQTLLEHLGLASGAPVEIEEHLAKLEAAAQVLSTGALWFSAEIVAEAASIRRRAAMYARRRCDMTRWMLRAAIQGTGPVAFALSNAAEDLAAPEMLAAAESYADALEAIRAHFGALNASVAEEPEYVIRIDWPHRSYEHFAISADVAGLSARDVYAIGGRAADALGAEAPARVTVELWRHEGWMEPEGPNGELAAVRELAATYDDAPEGAPPSVARALATAREKIASIKHPWDAA